MAGYENGPIRSTRTWYGPRTTEYSAGLTVKKNGQEKEVTVFYDQNSLDSQGNLPLLGKVPAGSKPSRILVYVAEAAGDGTDPTVQLGSAASGVEFVSAPIGVVGTVEGTPGAAIGAVAAADLDLYISFGGTAAPTVVGKGKIVFQYDYVNYLGE